MAVHIVCGLHRSGTTYVGKLLQQAGVVVVHEPLNERFGMQDVPITYPYVDDVENEYASLLDDVVNFRRAWNKDASFIRSKGVKKILYSLTGGRSGLRWSWLRLQHALRVMPKQLCLKDPFMSLATPYLVKKQGLKVVCMVRHPAAIHYSTAKQGWRFDIKNLRKQEGLIEKFASDISEVQWQIAEKHAAASIAILWKLMVRINQGVGWGNSNLKIIKHEDLCLDPMYTVEEIFKHFEVPLTQKIKSFVIENSQGSSAEPINGKVHSFKREAKALVDIWRVNGNKEDEMIIRDIAHLELESIYGDKR